MGDEKKGRESTEKMLLAGHRELKMSKNWS
jgi:hypothetical protein